MGRDRILAKLLPLRATVLREDVIGDEEDFLPIYTDVPCVVGADKSGLLLQKQQRSGALSRAVCIMNYKFGGSPLAIRPEDRIEITANVNDGTSGVGDSYRVVDDPDNAESLGHHWEINVEKFTGIAD